MKVGGSVTVAATPERVFVGWADLERAHEHQAPTKERLKLSEGPVGVGTRFHAVDRWPGRDVSFEMEITEYSPPSVIAAEWYAPMAGSWRATFTSLGEQATRMDFVATIEPAGLMGLLEPLMRPWARRQLANGLNSFGRWVEAGT